MKKSEVCLLACITACSTADQAHRDGVGGRTESQEAADEAPARRDDWRLAWSDEFDGASIDGTKWSFEVGDGGGTPAGPGWGNGELEYYTSRTTNAHVEGGYLIITARKDGPYYGNGPSATYDYSSARMTTKGKADFLYGRIEVRAMLPSGQGLWPAIWLLPTNPAYGGWAASGEINILESRGQDVDKLWGTLAFGEQWPRQKRAGCIYSRASGTFADDFHVFAIEWSATRIDWFVDGARYASQFPIGPGERGPVCIGSTLNPDTNFTAGWYSSGGDPPAPFNRPFHLILNLAVGGNFGGAAGGSFPHSMRVDYVRVYQG